MNDFGAIGQLNPFANFPNRPKLTYQSYHFADDRECASTVWAQQGTGSETTFSTVSDEVGGAVTATTQSSTPAQGDNVTAQHVAEQFKLSLGATLLFTARMKWDEVTNSQQIACIAKQATSGIGGTSGTGNFYTDVLGGFWVDDGDAHIDFIYGKNIASSNANYSKPSLQKTVDLVANTYVDLSFRIKMDETTAQKGFVEAWVNGVKIFEGTITDLCEDEEGALTMGCAVGATPGGVTRSYSCDLIQAFQLAA